MKIIKNYCLSKHNTFHISAKADMFIEYSDDIEIVEYLKKNSNLLIGRYLIVGDGSNLLFTKDFDGLVIHPNTKEISILAEDENTMLVKAAAGVVWDDFVEWTIVNKCYGLENLSLIPGTVGASAVQNIGAYGVEASEFIHEVQIYNFDTRNIEIIINSNCNYAYRDSIFKNELYDKTLVLNVIYRLKKKADVNVGYADIQRVLEGVDDVSPLLLRNTIIDIRNAKLPDPEKIGNAGSFFKNPVIDNIQFNSLHEKFSDLRFYALENSKYKIAAAWMIDQCGFKGFEHKGAAVHENQALVIINKTGNAKGSDILELSEIIKSKVFKVYGIKLEAEVIFL